MLDKKIIIKVKKKLLDKGMTQKELTKVLGVSNPQRLNNFLNGRLHSLTLEKQILEWLQEE